MPDDNGRQGNIEQWILRLDAKEDAHAAESNARTNEILEKLATLAPVAQVVALEKRTRYLEAKAAAIAALATTAYLWIKSYFTGP